MAPLPPPLSGTNDFSILGGTGAKSGAVTRAWSNETMPADVQVSAAVYVSSLIPAQVFARGSNIDPTNGDQASFYAVQLSRDDPGPLLAIVKDVNGTQTPLASINAPTYIDDAYLVETLDVEGSTVRAQLFNPNTGDYLNSAGSWQTNQAWALTVIDNSVTGQGVVGLGRPSSDTSYQDTVSFDDFSVMTPATDQSFDATPVGLLPDNWNWYGTNSGSDTAAVAAPTNLSPLPSAPNVLAITPDESGDSVRAWLNTSLPANLSVSAYTYVDTLTPAQVFARGSDLSTASPSYYAVEVSRGYLTASLVKVIDGTQTVLGTSVTSKSYVPINVWVQETLELNGDNLDAIVYRTDTDQYLDSSGDWVASWTPAVTATDSSITTGGQAGVGRPVVGQPLWLETDYFDDFTTETGMATQDFDSPSPPPSPPALPTGWFQYSSGSSNDFSIATYQINNQDNFLSANQVLESAEMPSTDTATAWDNSANDQLTNAQVTAAVYMAGTMPTIEVVARGTNLNLSNPSYYGLSFTETDVNGVALEELNLVRVNDGGTPVQLVQYEFPDVTEPETQLTSYGYLNTWVQETLYVDGDNVRASIYRTDTGQYLNSDGQWQTLPTYAINVIDPDPLIQAGSAGFVRPTNSASYTGFIDNFAIVPLSVDSTPPSATVAAPSGTQTGTVTITATATQTVPASNYAIDKVEFYVYSASQNPILDWVATTPSSGSGDTWNYTWQFNTSSVANGTYTILVKVYDDEGNIGEATTTITTSNNTSVSMPSNFTPHQNDIGITELDYEAGAYDATLLQDDVDVVVVDEGVLGDLAKIHNVYPNDQELIYSNVSNIADSGGTDGIGQVLSNWLNYAYTNGINPEDAFYHVAVATPFSYSDSAESAKPVDWFLGVSGYQDGIWNDFTAAAHAAQDTNGVPFGDLSTGSVVGDTLNVGYTDKYDQINVTLSQAGSGGSYVLEYPTAVNSSGEPTAWTTLTAQGNSLSDGTNGLTQNGTITFVPPSNWVPAVIDGTANYNTPFYYIRFRTTTAFSTIPVASTILGQNYTDYTNNDGTISGVIPAYDWTLDPSGGYLDASQYATAVAAGDTARFGYQSRLFYDGQMRFYTNPSNPEFQAWALQYYPGFLNPNSSLYQQYATGFFMDNSEADPPGTGGSAVELYNIKGNNSTSEEYKIDLIEPTDSYSNDYATLLNDIAVAIAPEKGWIMANTNGALPVPGGQTGQTYADPVIDKVQSYYEEFGLSAAADDTTEFLSLYNKIYYRATSDNSNYRVIDSTPSGGPAMNPQQDGQTQLTTLAAYYILAPNTASAGGLDFYSDPPSSDWVVTWSPPVFNHWSQAATYNVGTPVSDLPSTPKVLVANGQDPENQNYTFNVYERSFTGSDDQPVLVLYKTDSQDGDSKGHYNDPNTATTVNLPGSYYVLQPNGTLSSTAVTSISLENGEGAILVDPGTDGPEIRGATRVAASGSTNGLASAMSSTPSISLPAVIPGGMPIKPLAAAAFGRLLSGLLVPNATGPCVLAEQRDASAELDELLSLSAVQNLTASDAGGDGPGTNWPTQTGPGPITALVPPVGLSLGSLQPSKGSNNASITESSPADDAAAGVPVDDPATPSSAS